MNLDSLTYEQLLHIRLELNQRIADIEKDAYDKLTHGKPVVGFELVKGRKVRKIKNEGLLVQSLYNKGFKPKDLYDAKLKGIPALEKIVAAGDLDDHIEVTISEPKLKYTGA